MGIDIGGVGFVLVWLVWALIELMCLNVGVVWLGYVMQFGQEVI